MTLIVPMAVAKCTEKKAVQKKTPPGTPSVGLGRKYSVFQFLETEESLARHIILKGSLQYCLQLAFEISPRGKKKPSNSTLKGKPIYNNNVRLTV